MYLIGGRLPYDGQVSWVYYFLNFLCAEISRTAKPRQARADALLIVQCVVHLGSDQVHLCDDKASKNISKELAMTLHRGNKPTHQDMSCG